MEADVDAPVSVSPDQCTWRRVPWLEAALFASSAAFALLAARFGLAPHQAWGRMTFWPYAIAAVLVVVLAIAAPRASRTRARIVLTLALLGAVTIAPLGDQVAKRAADHLGHHAQSEVLVVEQASSALFRGENPYDAVFDDGLLARRKTATQTHYPYLPGMLILGAVPDGLGALSDARVAFTAATLAVFALALAVARRRMPLLRALQVLAVLPTGALVLATGGDDLPVLALMLLALVLVDRRHPVAAGVAIGLAAAMKQLAWPLIPFLVVAARDRDDEPARGRMLAATGLVLVPVVLPFVIWDPGAFIEDAVRFPLGLSSEASAAASPTLGRLLTSLVPGGGAVLGVALPLALLVSMAFILWRRPPRTPAAAALIAGLLIAGVVAFAPAVRFGILVYAVNLLVWAWVLRPEDAGEREAVPRLQL